MYSLVYLILYPDVPVGRIICISLYLDVPIKRIINVIKSCKVIEVNPPLLIEGQSPHSCGALPLLESPTEFNPGK